MVFKTAASVLKTFCAMVSFVVLFETVVLTSVAEVFSFCLQEVKEVNIITQSIAAITLLRFIKNHFVNIKIVK